MNQPVRLSNDRVSIEILPLGATLHRFEVREPGGGLRNIVLSRTDPDRTDDSYLGATVGRLANRVDGSQVTIDGVPHDLAPNEGANQLHGGPGGFSEVVWDVTEVGEDRVVLHLVSPDGDQGYPGRMEVTAAYSLLPDGAEVVYSATTDAPTVVNLTTHPYFILGDAGIEDHVVTAPTSHYTPTRDDLIPTGELADVAGTAFDLRAPRVVGEVIAEAVATGLARKGGVDQNFAIAGTGLREHVRLSGPSGLTLVVRSDAPGLQLYSGEHLGRAGLAIEPQGFPDAPNHPGFPPVDLLPGQEYRATTQWLIG